MFRDLSIDDWDLIDLETTLTERVWQDEDFRQRLLADPKGTIERETGCRLPLGMRISVHEESATERHLIIPTRPTECEYPRPIVP